MGVFSWECLCCGQSIRHKGATNKTSKWMAQAVVMFPNGNVISGEYNGYGRIGIVDVTPSDGEMAVYHDDCYQLAGKPKYKEPSESARDQGHFVGDNHPTKPKTLVEAKVMRAPGR